MSFSVQPIGTFNRHSRVKSQTRDEASTPGWPSWYRSSSPSRDWKMQMDTVHGILIFMRTTGPGHILSKYHRFNLSPMSDSRQR